ncbi:MAG: pyrroloquinoline-quinone synthase PqqC [Candidatus Sulfotelmatobacter sp.]
MAVRSVGTSDAAGRNNAAKEDTGLLRFDELRGRLRAVGEERYHHQHPFHLMMHAGQLTRGQLQAWALNRYYYQSIIPIKDSIILSRGPDPAFRRVWRKRVVDHDGDPASDGVSSNTGSINEQTINEGGIKRWLKLAEATGLSPDDVRAGKGILPATRFAVNEYLNIVRSRTLLEAVASSLTEIFSRDLITLRMEKLRQHYPWLSGGLDYFEARLTQAPEDAAFAVTYVFENARTRAEQELAINALRDKCDILWAQLDALYFAYVQPGWPPPGAFRIERDKA